MPPEQSLAIDKRNNHPPLFLPSSYERIPWQMLSHLRISNCRLFFISFVVLVIFLCADSMINWVTDLLVPQLTSRSGIVFFIVLAFVYGYGSYFLLSFVTRNTREIREKNASIKKIHILVIASQIALSATLTYIIISIITSSKYYTASLIGASVISQFVTIFISVLFARTFFAWYKSNRNSIIVLIYGLSFAVNALTIAESSMLDIDAMLKKPPIITPDSEVVFPSDIYESGTLLRILSDNYQYSSAATFILVLTATALLLYNYIKRLGRAKYWILVLLPLLYQIMYSVRYIGYI